MIVDFAAFSPAEHAAAAGSKAATLAQMFQAGLPVPDGFVILRTAFSGGGLTPKHALDAEVRFAALAGRSTSGKVAVRSSGLNEDSRAVSHAGEYSSVLNVANAAQFHAAVATVVGSAHGTAMAVVVQELVEPEYAGVMFTLDPVSGDAGRIVGNFTTGLADTLLAGDRTPLSFSIDRGGGRYDGDPSLCAFAPALLGLALRLERFAGAPVDIEWALSGGKIFIVQCRPVTTPVSAGEPWNDSLLSDCLWTNTNTGEAFNGTLTPMSGSAMVHVINRVIGEVDGLRMVGLIAGRLYLNLSWSLAIYRRLGIPESEARRALALLGGNIPDGITIPDVTIRFAACMRFTGRMLQFAVLRAIGIRRWLAWFRDECPAWCEARFTRIAACTDHAQLLAIAQEVEAKLLKSFGLLTATMNALSQRRMEIERQLYVRLPRTDAEVLLSGLGQGGLESLQPLLSFSALMRGEMSREDFLRRYGHRSSMELEIAAPRPAEDPAWLDTLRQQWSASAPEALVSSQHAARAAIWNRFGAKHRKLRRHYERCSNLMKERELIRSESMRIGWVSRKIVLKAAALAGLDDELFFLEGPEFTAFLQGDRTVLARVPLRKRWYERYRALPRLPSYISGAFRPFDWLRDPARRSDLFDAHRSMPVPENAALKGFPGSAGVVEGRVRLLESPQQFAELQDGEILVTSHTNIGWTLLFPRVAAIVTDIGAPLSHTAIVARELGIPAVVGTGNATARLKTGDRIRVDGSAGTIALLDG